MENNVVSVMLWGEDVIQRQKRMDGVLDLWAKDLAADNTPEPYQLSCVQLDTGRDYWRQLFVSLMQDPLLAPFASLQFAFRGIKTVLLSEKPYIHFLVLCLYSALLMQLPFITFDTPNSDHLSLSLVYLLLQKKLEFDLPLLKRLPATVAHHCYE